MPELSSIALRSLAALLVSWLLAMIMGPLVIPGLRRLKFGQQVRTDGPQTHLVKQGTPTMGGIIFIVPTVVATLLFAPRSAWPVVLLAILIAVGHGAIGFADDYVKVALKRSLGLRARDKLIGQLLLALLLGYGVTKVLDLGTTLWVPYFGWAFDLGLFYWPFVIFMALAVTNAVQITDGLDGLLGGVGSISGLFYALTAALLGNGGLTVFNLAMVGGLLGFLWYNRHPARVFMGDTGSLFLGGAVLASAVLTKTELLFLVVGLVYVAEVLSVVLQVASFKLTGRRIFRMSPLHHHFELVGLSETQVVTRFYSAALVAAALAALALGGLP